MSEPDVGPVCQYCLADPRYTNVSVVKSRRCPVCGADYTGPRRSKEYAVLLKNRLVASED